MADDIQTGVNGTGAAVDVESVGGANGAGDAQTEGNGAGNAAGTQAREPLTLDAALSDKALQAEFDKRMAKALQTARGKWEREATMTAEERAAETLREREAALAEREAGLRQRELAAHANAALRQRGLPDSLLSALGSGFADERDAEARVSTLEKAYRKAVDAAVQERMRGSAPRDAAPDADAALRAQMRKAAGLGEAVAKGD